TSAHPALRSPRTRPVMRAKSGLFALLIVLVDYFFDVTVTDINAVKALEFLHRLFGIVLAAQRVAEFVNDFLLEVVHRRQLAFGLRELLDGKIIDTLGAVNAAEVEHRLVGDLRAAPRQLQF